MANPQKEEGYTAIANEIVEAICRYPFSGHELRMLLLIIRKTYGFNKTEDAVSLSQMMKALLLSKTRCSQVINRLQLHKIVTVTENINGIGKKYKFNKDFEGWNTIHIRVNRYSKVKSTVTVLSNIPLQKSVSTKDTITKDIIQKTTTFILPDYIPEETWKAYLILRTKKKAANTDYALKLIIKELEKLKTKYGNNPLDVLNKSIKSGWVDMYQLKEEGGDNGNRQTNTYQRNTRADQQQSQSDEFDRVLREIQAKKAAAASKPKEVA
jgi:phage replication O-like protein O